MKKVFVFLLLLCAAGTHSWCKTSDTLRGAQYYDQGRLAFNKADYAAALSNLTTFRTLNKTSLQTQYAFAWAKVEQTISVCLEEIGDAPALPISGGIKMDTVIQSMKYRLALPPTELLQALGNTSDSGNAISQFVNDSSARYFYLGLMEREKKNELHAIAHFEKAMGLDSSNGAAALELAMSRGLMMRSSPGQSVSFTDISRSVVKADSQIILAAYMGLANKRLFEKKYAEAWQYYEKAAKVDEQHIAAQRGIAEVCLKMNRMAPALKAMEAVAMLQPGDYENQWKLACMYYNFGQYDKVVPMIPVLRTRVTDPKGWAFMLGKAHLARQNYGKSIEYLEQTIKDEPANSEAPYLIARMLVQMEQYRQAIFYYRKTLAIDSVSQPNRIYELAQALSTDRQFSESLACFKKALDRGYKANHDFYKNMTNTMADAYLPAESVKTLQELLASRPDDVALINALAGLYYDNDNYKDAISTWNRLMTGNDKNARTLYKIGRAYIKMGKGNEGRSLCRQATEMDPSLSEQSRVEGD